MLRHLDSEKFFPPKAHQVKRRVVLSSAVPSGTNGSTCPRGQHQPAVRLDEKCEKVMTRALNQHGALSMYHVSTSFQITSSGKLFHYPQVRVEETGVPKGIFGTLVTLNLLACEDQWEARITLHQSFTATCWPVEMGSVLFLTVKPPWDPVPLPA